MEMRESGSGHAQAVVIGAHMSLPVEREADKEPLPLPLSLPRTCIRRDGDESYHIKFMYVSAMLYFFSLGLTSISLVFLINRRIAGDPTDPNSSSILVQTTVVFLNNASSFLCLRYNSGLGDYLGRKPILAFSAFALMVTRLCYSFAHKPVHFFIISFFAGATESFFYSTLAWVCDIIPSHSERSKYYGTFAGIAGMAGIVIGSPVGAALSIAVSPTAPFLASTVFSLLSVAVTILNPCCDTHALESMSSSEYISISEKRALPKDFCHFFTEHFPISKTTFEIIMQSKKPMDWVTFSVAQWTWALLVLILVQFLLKVYDWSGPLAAFCLLSMGLSLGAFVPCMQNRFEPVSLSFYSMGCQVVGYTLLSISGTGVSGYIYIGVAGLVFVALGLSWLPCSQSILMSGYEYGMQGVVSGLLGQISDFAMLPGYLVSLSFTFNSERGEGEIYWPGCAFGISAVILLCTMSIHYSTHGKTALTLQHRKYFKGGESVVVPSTFSKIPVSTPQTTNDVDDQDYEEDYYNHPGPN